MAITQAASAGLAGAKGIAKSLGAVAKTAVNTTAGGGIVSRAVGTAALTGAAGAGINAVRGEDAWEGAKTGAMLGAGASLGKSAVKGEFGKMLAQTSGGAGAATGMGPDMQGKVASLMKAGKKGGSTKLPGTPASFNSNMVRSVDKNAAASFGQSTSFLDDLSGMNIKFGKNVGAVQSPRASRLPTGRSKATPPNWSKAAKQAGVGVAKDVKTLERFGRDMSLSQKIFRK